MATKIETRSDNLYEQDYYVWAERQAALLRLERFDELDLAHLVEEVEDLAALAKSSVFNNARVVMEHLLKLQHSPAVQPRRLWRASVREHRRRIEIDITPRLRQLLEADLERLYRMAERDVAASLRDFGEDDAAGALPSTCPYTVEQILGDWLP
jgi:hypothetical protein